MIRIWCDFEASAADTKDAVDKLLEGAVIMYGESALWDAWFSSHTAAIYLHYLCKNYHIHISVDSRRSQLVLYGSDI
jgi:hypothetical protein